MSKSRQSEKKVQILDYGQKIRVVGVLFFVRILFSAIKKKLHSRLDLASSIKLSLSDATCELFSSLDKLTLRRTPTVAQRAGGKG